MRNLNDLIEEIVHLRGVIEFDDLSVNDKRSVFSYVLANSEFDVYDLLFEELAIPSLILSMMNGIEPQEHVGDEIYDRFEDFFRPIINDKLEDEYAKQYANGDYQDLDLAI